MSHFSAAPRLPLSPASPPESGVKQQPKYRGSTVTPQTPPSPDSMSVATKRYVSSYEDGRHTNEMENRSSDNYVHHPQRSSIHISNPQQQSSTLKRSLPQDEEEERSTSNKRQKQETTENRAEDDSSFTATNHDRQKEQRQKDGISAGTVTASQEGVTVCDPSENAKVAPDPIFNDIGPAFKIGRKTRKRAEVDMNKHLLGHYGLHPLLATVARNDPETGEKINKLRKSYEGQIKVAGLSGKNKPYKALRNEDEPSKLRMMATVTEDDFAETQSDQKVGDLKGLQDVLQSALRLNSGTMPNKIITEWDEILGHEPKRPAQQPQFQHPIPHIQHARLPNGALSIQNNIASAAPDKMRTRGKKRGYSDDSFAGYPGFGDGLSEPEDEGDKDQDYADRGKRRRKD